MGKELGYVDVQFAPWMLRCRRVLGPYRGWPEPEEGSRWARWVEAVEGSGTVRGTTSGDELYLDSYERYAGESSHTCRVEFGLTCIQRTVRTRVRLLKRSMKVGACHEVG
jgi:hypothetical protein